MSASTPSQKPKAKKSMLKKTETDQSTSSPRKGPASFSSDEEPSVNSPRTPASKSRNPGILPNSSPTRTSDFLGSEVFDYDRIRQVSAADEDDNELELWIVRVPLGIKPKALEKLQVDLEAFPSASSSSTHAKVGTLARKNTSYDVWNISSSGSPSKRPGEVEEDDVDSRSMVGGEEILGMQCLLPRKRDGKVYIAPSMKTKHLVLCQAPSLPTPPPSTSGSLTTKDEEDRVEGRITASSRRYSHPAHLLKHRFLPTGSLTCSEANASREEDTSDSRHLAEAATASTPKKDPTSSPKKKRKADGKEDKKKTKKAKTGS